MSEQLYICDYAEDCGDSCLTNHNKPHALRPWCEMPHCSAVSDKVSCIPVPPPTLLERIASGTTTADDAAKVRALVEAASVARGYIRLEVENDSHLAELTGATGYARALDTAIAAVEARG